MYLVDTGLTKYQVTQCDDIMAHQLLLQVYHYSCSVSIIQGDDSLLNPFPILLYVVVFVVLLAWGVIAENWLRTLTSQLVNS